MEYRIETPKPKFKSIEVVILLDNLADLKEMRNRLNNIPPISTHSDALAAHRKFATLWGALNTLYQKRKWS